VMATKLDDAVVLLIDDDPIGSKVLSVMLPRVPVADVVVSSGVDEAIDLLAERTVDIALVDLQMPERHGLQFISDVRCRRTAARHDLPCLILTQSTEPPIIGLGMALDVEGILAKPAKLPMLRDHLGRVMASPTTVGPAASYEAIDVSPSLEDLITAIGSSTVSSVTALPPGGRALALDSDDLPDRAVLGSDLVNGAGQVLLKAGTPLDPAVYARLRTLMDFDPAIRTIVLA